MSKSQYETYEAYGPYSAPDGVPGGARDDVWPGVHDTETLGYGVAYGTAYDDTYRPAYEMQAPAPAQLPTRTPGYARVSEPVLPRQSGSPFEDDGGGALHEEEESAFYDDVSAAGDGVHELRVRPRTSRRATGRRRARAAERPESAVRRLLPQALVVAFLAGGTTAFVAKDKTIELSVDGKQRTLHTFSDDVSELLAAEDLHVGTHDLVAPDPGAALASGDQVAVRYGRPVRLTLDGERREVWTTARTVDGALRELGVRPDGAYLSAARSQGIGRAGLALDVRTERSVTVMADGRTRTIRTNAATVREAVEEAGITLRRQDTTSVPPDSFPRDGQTVTVLRVTGVTEVREESIPFAVERTEDPTLFKGTEVIEWPGQPGLRRITYLLRTVNGVQEKPRKEKSEVVRKPSKQVVKVGTKPRPKSVQGADHLNWHGLATCESGGRPGAVDPSGTYGGLYQFDAGTWHSLGGNGRPQDATAEEQTFRAKKLYVRRGASPWPHCGARLHP
ncbi:transglycosylase [Streptomyces cellostaticus]|uniref:Transglycosylase n=1 Tax=Streptomyces cellostaticus TaxID=67285 RepID=A0A117PVL9_9ACTN|nr:resuscitation-promoting factor [Streptomyces cellostaticus]KUM94340.1 transglycosylase [Streptomyces cellostaticus]